MKKIFCSLFISLLSLWGATSFAQTTALTGPWHGKISFSGTELTLVLRFGADSVGNTVCALDSPDQGVYGIPATIQLLEEDTLAIAIPTIGAAFEGRQEYTSEPSASEQEAGSPVIIGTFTQMGLRFPLTLKPGEPVRNRPQEPKPPYPYRTEEVTFTSGVDGAVLAGTLTFPTDYDSQRPEKTPVVLMITGSGTQNRDEEIMGHKPFLVIADYLARNGIASLRYDDRGAGASQKGTAEITTGLNMQDAVSGLQFLRERNQFGKVGAIGHSEGGTIVFMLGSRGEADFIVSMAGASMRGDSILVEQNRLMLTKSGFTQASADNYCKVLNGILQHYVGSDSVPSPSPEAFVDSLVTALDAANLPFGSKANLVEVCKTVPRQPWMLEFIRFSPASDISSVTCPVMAVNGSLDLQVLPANLEQIRCLLPPSENHLIKEYPGLNHLFQPCTTGLSMEYPKIETTISTEVLEDIAEWICHQ